MRGRVTVPSGSEPPRLLRRWGWQGGWAEMVRWQRPQPSLPPSGVAFRVASTRCVG